MSNNEHKSCPSSTCSEDALLLGKVRGDGTVAFVQTELRLDAESAAAFKQLGHPERHFRFSQPCAQNGCRQWSSGQCSVIKTVLDAVGNDLPPDAPNCLIRPTCRWYYQEGVQACYACAFVVADVTVPAMEVSV
jgi:hypothetical protein